MKTLLIESVLSPLVTDEAENFVVLECSKGERHNMNNIIIMYTSLLVKQEFHYFSTFQMKNKIHNNFVTKCG